MLKCYLECTDLKTGKSEFQEMHSFVANFLIFLTRGFGFSHELNGKDTSGSISYSKLSYCGGGTNDQRIGLLLGTGDTPVSVNDRCLESEIALTNESVCFSNSLVVNGLNCFTVERYFTNGSAGNIVIKELALYQDNLDNPGNSECMLSRDVLDTPITFEPDDRKLLKMYVGSTADFNQNFLWMLEFIFRGASGEAKNTLGSYVEEPFSVHYLNAGAGKSRYGIWIGSGDTAFNMSDYNMSSLLSSGWSRGETFLEYLTKSLAPDDIELAIFRNYTNNTGSTQTVREVGIVISSATAQDAKSFLIARYVIEPKVVANGQAIKVTWKFNTPVLTYVEEGQGGT